MCFIVSILTCKKYRFYRFHFVGGERSKEQPSKDGQLPPTQTSSDNTSLHQLNEEPKPPISNDTMTPITHTQDDNLMTLTPELEIKEYPKLRTSLVSAGHKDKRKETSSSNQGGAMPSLAMLAREQKQLRGRAIEERTGTVELEDVFNVPPSVHLFDHVEPSIHSFEEQLLGEQVLGEVDNYEGISRQTNGFQVQMLNDQKRWQFPIDNQEDMEDDHTFHDHVFLDHHLVDFPQVEPVLKYMELVITGLQQNPYLSYEEKVGKIMWYKTYFSKFSVDALI